MANTGRANVPLDFLDSIHPGDAYYLVSGLGESGGLLSSQTGTRPGCLLEAVNDQAQLMICRIGITTMGATTAIPITGRTHAAIRPRTSRHGGHRLNTNAK